MNVYAVCEFWVYGKTQSRWVRCHGPCSIVYFEVLYSAGSGVNRVQVVLSGFSVRLLCFFQTKTLYIYICLYVYIYCTRACVC